jgi:hypothetical protein
MKFGMGVVTLELPLNLSFECPKIDINKRAKEKVCEVGLTAGK